ncbi:hypothetical protein BS78_07G025200 [Paspalum vaginatum]|nr:hypothetical protein BS78_07G025200 [Paspalum vaginatum]
MPLSLIASSSMASHCPASSSLAISPLRLLARAAFFLPSISAIPLPSCHVAPHAGGTFHSRKRHPVPTCLMEQVANLAGSESKPSHSRRARKSVHQTCYLQHLTISRSTGDAPLIPITEVRISLRFTAMLLVGSVGNRWCGRSLARRGTGSGGRGGRAGCGGAEQPAQASSGLAAQRKRWES